MKQKRNIWTMLMVLVLGIITACQPEPLAENAVVVPESEGWEPTMSIEEFKVSYDVKDSLFSINNIESNVIIRGRVVSTDVAGNIYKYFVMQDATGEALKVSVDAGSLSGTIPMGQEIAIQCNGLALGRYADMVQLGVEAFNDEKMRVEPGRIPYPYFSERMQLIGKPDVSKIVVDTMTIAELLASDSTVHSRLICIKDVHFTGLGDDGEKLRDEDKIFAPSTFNGTYNVGYPQARQIADASGNVAYISTSEYARFADMALPAEDKWGNVVAIVGWYDDKADDDSSGEFQLTIRTLDDLQGFFDGSEVTPDTPAEDGVLFSETFASSLGQFTIDDKNLPEGLSYVWKHSTYNDEGFAKASAYYQKDYVAESWLVSPTIELNGKPATLVFDHAANYIKNDKAEDMRVLYTTDGGAKWVEAVIPTYPVGGNFDFVSSGEIGFPAATSIQFAFAYKSTSKGACTWEIKNVKVLDKEAEVITPDDPTPDNPPVSGEGDGSKENPYNVATAMQVQDGSEAWVKAYIVGQVAGDWDVDMQYDAPFTGAPNDDGSIKTYGTNLLISDNVNANTTAQVMPVQLPSGAVRRALNLVENPGMDGKEVLLYGKLTKYFSVAGLKEVSCAIVDGEVYGKEPTVVEGETILNVPFTSGLGGFETFSIKGSQEWASDATYGAKMSGYADGSSHANEDWLVSPALNLAGKSRVVLTFDHAINKGDLANLTTNHTLWITDEYTDTTPTDAIWEQVEITTYPDGKSWTYVSSGEIVLPAEYMKDNVRIAFKYLCSDKESATWEIRDLILQ